MLLSYFLHAAPHFVADVLYELSLVERHVIEFSGFETDLVDAQFFRDRVVIKSQLKTVTEREPLDFVLSVDEAKLLLLEWGVEIQRWRMEHHKTES